MYSAFNTGLPLWQMALSYMSDYGAGDVMLALLEGNSSSAWTISPPAKAALVADLNGTGLITLTFKWCEHCCPPSVWLSSDGWALGEVLLPLPGRPGAAGEGGGRELPHARPRQRRPRRPRPRPLGRLPGDDVSRT